MQDFPTALRHWRRTRRLSQLDLASDAEVSPRHLAFLETGRSRPSRGMVLRLAEEMGLPRGEQNGLLAVPEIAGFRPQVSGRPVLPTVYKIGERRLAMVSTYAQFGAADEVGLSDKKIELMVPADSEAEAALRQAG